MSLTRTEFALQRRDDHGIVLSKHGPYETLGAAELQKRSGEHMSPQYGWIIVERDVTEWTVVPTREPPSTKSVHWPTED